MSTFKLASMLRMLLICAFLAPWAFRDTPNLGEASPTCWPPVTQKRASLMGKFGWFKFCILIQWQYFCCWQLLSVLNWHDERRNKIHKIISFWWTTGSRLFPLCGLFFRQVASGCAGLPSLFSSPARPHISHQSPPTHPRRSLVGREKRVCFARVLESRKRLREVQQLQFRGKQPNCEQPHKWNKKRANLKTARQHNMTQTFGDQKTLSCTPLGFCLPSHRGETRRNRLKFCADTKKQIHKTSGLFIAIYFTLYSHYSGPYFLLP